jgi:hypothetical protein
MLIKLTVRSTLGQAGEVVEVSPSRAGELLRAGLAKEFKPVSYETKVIKPETKRRGRPPKQWNSSEQSSSPPSNPQ